MSHSIGSKCEHCQKTLLRNWSETQIGHCSKAVSPRLHLLVQNTVNRKNVKYYYNLKQLFSVLICVSVIYSCDVQLYFQHHYCSLQCHMIFRNHNGYTDLLLKKHF